LVRWDVESGASTASAPFRNGVGFDYAPDGRHVVVTNASGNAAVLESASLAPLRRLPRRRLQMSTAPACGAGDGFLQGSWRGPLLVRDARTGEELLREEEPGRMIAEVARTPDGTRTAYATLTHDDIAVQVRDWPFTAHAPVEVLRRAPSGTIARLALSADGRLVAARFLDRVVVVTAEGDAVAERELPFDGVGPGIAWSPDGELATTAGGRALGFTPALDELWSLDVPQACAVAYSPGGDGIAIGSWRKGFTLDRRRLRS
jgi:hypothetical protein